MVKVTSSQKSLPDRIREAAAQAEAKKGWLVLTMFDGKKYGTQGPIDLSDDSLTFVDYDEVSRSVSLNAIAQVHAEDEGQ